MTGGITVRGFFYRVSLVVRVSSVDHAHAWSFYGEVD